MRNVCVLEAQQFVSGGKWDNDIFKHIGYMDLVFRTKQEAFEYYDTNNPHLRKMNAHGTERSDWDPDTKLRYVVRKYDGECQHVPPFGMTSAYKRFILQNVGITKKVNIDKYMRPVKIEECPTHILALQRSLEQDGSDFRLNMPTIIDAYVNGTLYGMETFDDNHEQNKNIVLYTRYMGYQFNTVPALAIVDDSQCVWILWVHSAFRKQGIGSAFIKQLGIKTVKQPLPESIGFF